MPAVYDMVRFRTFYGDNISGKGLTGPFGQPLKIICYIESLIRKL